MKRVLTISTIASAIFFCFLVIIWPVSYHLDLTKGLGSGKPVPSDSVPIISGYRLGFEDGAVWFYNYDIPWLGGTGRFADTNLLRVVWYRRSGDYNIFHENDFKGRDNIVETLDSCNLPGIYFYRIWERGNDPAYTTLSASL